MESKIAYTASGYAYFTNSDSGDVYILKHDVVVGIIQKQSLTAEGVEKLVESFGLIYDELLYSDSSYKAEGYTPLKAH